MHVSDWLPTLGKLAGVKFNREKLDGVDQWGVINGGGFPARNEIVNIDNVLNFGSFIYGPYKLVNGSLAGGTFDGWLSSTNKSYNNDPIDYALNVLTSEASRAILSIQKKNRLSIDKILQIRSLATARCTNGVEKNGCDLSKGPCVFDIYNDPCEENNLAGKRPMILRSLLQRYNERVHQAVPSRRQPTDPASDPVHFDLNWQWWQEDS